MASDLRETYKTLRRRGMPPHPELRNSGGVWGLIQGHVREEDARDLITMHALRWWAEVTKYTMSHDRLEEILSLTADMEPSNG